MAMLNNQRIILLWAYGKISDATGIQNATVEPWDRPSDGTLMGLGGRCFKSVLSDIWWYMMTFVCPHCISVIIYIYIYTWVIIYFIRLCFSWWIYTIYTYIYIHNFCRYGSKYLLVSMWVRLGNEVPFQEVFGSMIDAHVPGVKIDAQLFRHWAASELLKLLSWIRCITPLCTEARVDSKDPATECAGCGVK